MKFCPKCGTQLVDEAVVCTGCGCAVAAPAEANVAVAAKPASGLTTAAKILMIISTVVTGFYLIPLAWCLPMTISYSKKIKNGEPVGTGFKICTLLFVNTIAGILMLCDKEH